MEQIAQVPLDRIKGTIINNYEEKKEEHKTHTQLLQEEYENGIFNNFIPADPWLEKVTNFRTNIFDYRENSKSSQAIKRLTWEVLRRI